MKWLIIFFVLSLAYVANYFRLAYSQSPVSDYVTGVEIGTNHNPFERTTFRDFTPQKTQLNGHYLGLEGDLPYMGTHRIDPVQWLKGFDPEHPAGYMTWKGKLVGYIYSASESDAKKYPYHWHRHKGLCVMEALVPTTVYSLPGCVLRGYFYLPQGKYMLHYWLIPNPNGVNDLFNPLLQ